MESRNDWNALPLLRLQGKAQQYYSDPRMHLWTIGQPYTRDINHGRGLPCAPNKWLPSS